MTLTTTRRALIATGTLGLGALSIPGLAQVAPMLGATGFTHSVASGEPGQDTMLLWTRYVAPRGDSAKLVVELSETPDFARVVATGSEITGPWRDWTTKITVWGLKPGTRYHYRFVAPDGTRSPTGTTRTLPQGAARSFKAAIFSCSNMGYGWFNAYAHAAARDDLDLAVHLGDYFYEYSPGTYPPAILAARNDGLLPRAPLHYVTKHLQQGIESDHFRVKKNMPRIGGFQSFRTARRTIQGFEAMLWLRKGFGFAGAWTIREQNRLLGVCFGLQAVNRA